MQSTQALQLKSRARVLFPHSCNSSDITCSTSVPCVSGLLAWKKINLAKNPQNWSVFPLTWLIFCGRPLALMLRWWCHRKERKEKWASCGKKLLCWLDSLWNCTLSVLVSVSLKMLSIQFIFLVCCSQASIAMLLLSEKPAVGVIGDNLVII